jgi:hypothetical protein
MSPEKLFDAALAFKFDAAQRALALLPLEARARLRKECAKTIADVANAAADLAGTATGLEKSLRAFSGRLKNDKPVGPVKVDIE